MTDPPFHDGETIPRRRRRAVLTSFAAQPLRMVRPDQAADMYVQPHQSLAKMAADGDLHRIANGYYVVVPRAAIGTGWLPQLEAAAAGIASADFGPKRYALMGVSAARMHGAFPRAHAVAVVAVPEQRAKVQLRDRNGFVRFVKRDVERLDAERLPTELGPVLVTTVEQTVLDLSHRPRLGEATRSDVEAAIRILLPRCDQSRLSKLAGELRLKASLDRAIELGRS